MTAYSVSSFIELMNSPKTFMRSISNMLQEETKYIGQLNILARSHVLSLSMVSVFSKDESVRDEALWTVANLIGADDTALRTFAIQHVREHNIVAAAAKSYRNDSSVTARSAAYFLYNWAHYIDNSADAKRFVMDLLPIALVRTTGSRDVLWAAIRVSKRFPDTIPVYVLTTALRNENMKPKSRTLIWNLIGTAAEETGLVDGSIDTLMLRLETYLPKVKTDKRRLELLWILSNLLCEDNGVGVFHYKYYSLRRIVENIAWTAKGGILHEALIVLANYVVRANEKEIQRYLAVDESLSLLFRTYAHHFAKKNVEVVNEGLKALEKYAAEHQQEPEIVDLTDDDDDDMTVSEAAPTFIIDNDHIPSAYDLLAGDFRGNESAAVRGLVAMLCNKPAGTWVALSPNYQLRIAELVNLQHLGYVIKDGYLGINPEIYGGDDY